MLLIKVTFIYLVILTLLGNNLESLKTIITINYLILTPLKLSKSYIINDCLHLLSLLNFYWIK